jgi:DNA gyrase/topoisomerase IV subunit B
MTTPAPKPLRDDAPGGAPGDERSLKYQRLTQEEHVAHRGAMYVGSMALERSAQWVAERTGDRVSVAQREVEFVPAVYKLFDELVTNAVDAAGTRR